MELKQAARRAWESSFALKSGERALVVCDAPKRRIGNAFFEAAKELGALAELLEIPVGARDGAEPPEEAARKMKEADAVAVPTSKSVSHTNARKAACEAGARVATLPGITEDIMSRLFDLDYGALMEEVRPLYDILSTSKKVRITTERGTDVTVNVQERPWIGLDSGIVRERGQFANLPDGELFIAPRQEDTNGKVVFDGSFAGIGKLAKPITASIENGFAAGFSGGKEADALSEMLGEVGDKNAYNVAELGIGTNPLARVSGNVLEDEKIRGTVHMAFGNNAGFGGDVSVPVHVDGIVTAPTVLADGQKVLDAGKWVFARA